MKSFPRAAILDALPPASQALVEALVKAAAEREARIYLVGGPVRDFLLGRPVRDVDLLLAPAPNAALSAEAVAREAAPADARVIEHERFGTVVIEADGVQIDLAGARRERYERGGALPQVEPAGLEEDLARRDFSVNAIALSLPPAGRAARCELVPAEGALADLESRRLRVLHDRSFHDDPTRALRAARLAPRLGFTLGRESRAALRDALRDGVFGAVSGERLRRELEKLFADARVGLNPAEALRRLAGWHVLTALEPGLGLPREAVVPLRRLGRSLADPPFAGPRLRPWAAGLAVWLAPLAPALRRRSLRRFSVRGELATRIAGFPKLRDTRLSAVARARGRGAVDALLAGVDEDTLYALHAGAPTPARRRLIRWAAEDRARRSPVSGSDLVALGLAGPAVGRALARVRQAFLDGAVANREEAMALAREFARRSRGRAPAGQGSRRK